jgi:polyhydroxyalkanoate synthesis repressor PhaR
MVGIDGPGIPMSDKVRLIKKYPNRRLYDTSESRYITLAEVREMVTRGESFKVVDSQSEEDLTRNILLQIIIEQESEQKPLFSTDILQQFIRFYGDSSQQGFTSFLEQTLHFFQEQQQSFQSQMKDMLGRNPVEFWSKVGEQNLNFWRQMQDNFLSASGLNKNDKPPKNPR